MRHQKHKKETGSKTCRHDLFCLATREMNDSNEGSLIRKQRFHTLIKTLSEDIWHQARYETFNGIGR